VRKLLAPVVACLAVSLALSACGTPVEPYAAVVGGTAISSGTLDSAMAAIANDTGYRCEILGGTSGGSSLAIEGAGKSTYSTGFAADVLSELIEYETAHLAVAQLHLAEGGYARTLAAEELPDALNPSSSTGCTESGAEIVATFASTYRTLLEQFELDDDVLAAHLSGLTLSVAGVSSYLARHPLDSTLDCTSLIETTSASAAASARAKIEAGASFASVAKADSKDTSAPGGAIGCYLASELPAPLNTVLASLPVGTVSAPVAYDSDYLLLLVTSHKRATAAEALPVVFNAAQTKVNAIVAADEKGAVTVDPSIGRWARSTSGYTVQANTGPTDALLPSPSAVAPPTASISPPS
jgi:hypothetical protein